MRLVRLLLLAVVTFGTAAVAGAAQLDVGAGSSLDLGTSSLNLGCANLNVGGTLDAGSVGFTSADDLTIGAAGVLNGESATLSVSGDWVNGAGGTFNAGTSTVFLFDGCGNTDVSISGDTTFSTLILLSSTGKTYRLESGSTQTVDVELTITGAEGDLLVLGSTLPGNEAFVSLQGTASIDFVTVSDIHGVPNRLVFGPNSVVGANNANASQCGDLDGDFTTALADVTMAREFLVGNTIAGDITLCNVIGPYDPLQSGADCKVDDIFVLERMAASEPIAAVNGCAP
jgi:hypothetical protein